MPRLKVGQTLWFTRYHSRSDGHEVAVTKVGSKWAYLNNHNRISIENWQVDDGGYSSPGRCYESKAAYDAEMELGRLEGRLRRAVTQHALRNVTADEIRRAADILKIDLGAEDGK